MFVGNGCRPAATDLKALGYIAEAHRRRAHAFARRDDRAIDEKPDRADTDVDRLIFIAQRELAADGQRLRSAHLVQGHLDAVAHVNALAALHEQSPAAELGALTDEQPLVVWSLEHEPRREGVRVLITVGAAALAQQKEDPATSLPPEPPPESLSGASAGAPEIQRATHVDGLRVLIVEDALLLALELESGLQEAGAHVIGCAADVEEALRMMELGPIDAAVLDANLNGRSVTPVAEALAARKVPFVFATGYGDAAGAPGDFQAPVIRKPYDVTQVAAALAELLRT